MLTLQAHHTRHAPWLAGQSIKTYLITTESSGAIAFPDISAPTLAIQQSDDIGPTSLLQCPKSRKPNPWVKKNGDFEGIKLSSLLFQLNDFRATTAFLEMFADLEQVVPGNSSQHSSTQPFPQWTVFEICAEDIERKSLLDFLYFDVVVFVNSASIQYCD